MTDTDSIGQTPSSLERYLVVIAMCLKAATRAVVSHRGVAMFQKLGVHRPSLLSFLSSFPPFPFLEHTLLNQLESLAGAQRPTAKRFRCIPV